MSINYNKNVNPTRLPQGVIRAVQELTGSADAVALRDGTVFINSTGVDAITLALPTSGQADGQPNGQDGLKMTFIDTGGHAHTITTPSTPVLGIVPSHHVITFNGTAGSFITLEAYGGVWYPLENSGITSIA